MGIRVVLGYRERLDVDHILEAAVRSEPALLEELDPRQALHVVSEPVLQVARKSPLAMWRRKLFLAMSRLARGPADQLSVTHTRTIVIGREVEI